MESATPPADGAVGQDGIEIRVLTFDGCPNAGRTVDLVRKVVARMGVPAEVREIRVDAGSSAPPDCFHGSPTVLVGGVDIEGIHGPGTPAMCCRVYRGPAGLRGVPPEDLVVEAVLRAARRAQQNQGG